MKQLLQPYQSRPSPQEIQAQPLLGSLHESPFAHCAGVGLSQLGARRLHLEPRSAAVATRAESTAPREVAQPSTRRVSLRGANSHFRRVDRTARGRGLRAPRLYRDHHRAMAQRQHVFRRPGRHRQASAAETSLNSEARVDAQLWLRVLQAEPLGPLPATLPCGEATCEMALRTVKGKSALVLSYDFVL